VAGQPHGLTDFLIARILLTVANMLGGADIEDLRLLRHEVEALVKEKSGKDHLRKKKLQKELSDLDKEARKLVVLAKDIAKRAPR